MNVKKILIWALVIFVVYAILTNPSAAADMFGSAWDIVSGGVENIFTFFDSLLNR